jgi:hypothetical protein
MSERVSETRDRAADFLHEFVKARVHAVSQYGVLDAIREHVLAVLEKRLGMSGAFMRNEWTLNDLAEFSARDGKRLDALESYVKQISGDLSNIQELLSNPRFTPATPTREAEGDEESASRGAGGDTRVKRGITPSGSDTPDAHTTFEEALSYAALAHEGQVYKGLSDSPYILHAMRVALAVPPTARIAAILHDTLEDKGSLPENLHPIDRAAIALLTRDKRSIGYAPYIDRIKDAVGPEGMIACQVKIADLRDNLAHDPPESLRQRYEAALETLGTQPDTPAPAPSTGWPSRREAIRTSPEFGTADEEDAYSIGADDMYTELTAAHQAEVERLEMERDERTLGHLEQSVQELLVQRKSLRARLAESRPKVVTREALEAIAIALDQIGWQPVVGWDDEPEPQSLGDRQYVWSLPYTGNLSPRVSDRRKAIYRSAAKKLVASLGLTVEQSEKEEG